LITLRFDGLFRTISAEPDSAAKTGLMCYGWLIFRDGRSVAHGHGAYARPNEASSNVAEYLALIEGLQALRDMGVEREAVEVIGDARSIIEQMIGRASVSSSQVRSLYHRACRLAQPFRRLTWTWQPRRDNHAADQLTRRALSQVRGDRESCRQALQEAFAPRHRGLTALLDLCVFS
jgi:ribonuclease HI